MIICVCKAVSDRRIRTAVSEGATCVRDLTRQFGLGTCCGKCVPDAKRTLAAFLGAGEERTSAGLFSAPAAELMA
jgi:bacterioferritin-associated ferredoxin